MASIGSEPPLPLRRPKRDRRPGPNGTSSSTRPDNQDDIPKPLQLRSFERNFDVETFISDLSDTLIASSKANAGPLNPIPFIQTFSPALDHLLELRKGLGEKTEALEKDVRIAEGDYSGRLIELNGGFESIGSAFTALETKITGVGKVAVRIGEQLETLHYSRSTAQSTSLLLSYYTSLSQPLPPLEPSPDPGAAPVSAQTPLDTLFATRTSREGRARLAIILRRLIALSKDVADNASSASSSYAHTNGGTSTGDDGKGKNGLGTKLRADQEKAEGIRDEVGKYAERFEKECLRLFDKSYRKGDVRMMAHCAKVLLEFNGGISCTQLYVNQHDFFIAKDRVVEEAQKAEEEAAKEGVVGIWQTIAKPDLPPPTSEPGMDALFKEIRLTVSQEAQIIQAVFPMKQEVMRVFLQRVFAQIQQHLESLFSRAEAIGSLALLRMLRLAHNACSKLVEDLKQYDFVDGAGSVANADGEELGAPKQVTRTSVVSTVLDQCMEEVCMPYLEGNRYMELETKWLALGYKSLLSKYSRSHEDLIKGKPTLLDRVVNLATGDVKPSSSSSGGVGNAASAASAAAASFLNRLGPGAPGMQSGHSGFTPAHNPKSNAPHGPAGAAPAQNPVEENFTETDRALRISTAEQMLQWHAEAIGRMIELVPAGEVAKHSATLGKLITDVISRLYLEVSLDSSLSKLDHSDSKKEVDLSPIASLQQVDAITYLWQKYANTALLPLIGSSISIRKDFVRTNTVTMSKVERKVDTVMQRTIDGILSWLSSQLKNQKANDYRPRNDDISFARNTTEPCQAVCEYLDRLKEAGSKALNGKNREAFFTEIAVAFHSLLLEHYKKFPVNPTGGLMLTKDLAAYQDIFYSLNIAAINDRFDMLRQLGNSFIVQPEVLKSYLTESYLGKIDARLLRPYLMQRSDWSTFARKFNEDLGTDTVGEPAGAVAGTGHVSRLSLGAGKLKELARSIDAFGDAGPTSSSASSRVTSTAPLRTPGNRNSVRTMGGIPITL